MLEITLELETEDLETGELATREVIVTFDVTPGSRGRRDRWGCPVEPDEPAEVEFVSAKWADTGEDCDLSDSDEDEARQLAYGQIDDE